MMPHPLPSAWGSSTRLLDRFSHSNNSILDDCNDIEDGDGYDERSSPLSHLLGQLASDALPDPKRSLTSSTSSLHHSLSFELSSKDLSAVVKESHMEQHQSNKTFSTSFNLHQAFSASVATPPTHLPAAAWKTPNTHGNPLSQSLPTKLSQISSTSPGFPLKLDDPFDMDLLTSDLQDFAFELEASSPLTPQTQKKESHWMNEEEDWDAVTPNPRNIHLFKNLRGFKPSPLCAYNSTENLSESLMLPPARESAQIIADENEDPFSISSLNVTIMSIKEAANTSPAKYQRASTSGNESHHSIAGSDTNAYHKSEDDDFSKAMESFLKDSLTGISTLGLKPDRRRESDIEKEGSRSPIGDVDTRDIQNLSRSFQASARSSQSKIPDVAETLDEPMTKQQSPRENSNEIRSREPHRFSVTSILDEISMEMPREVKVSSTPTNPESPKSSSLMSPSGMAQLVQTPSRATKTITRATPQTPLPATTSIREEIHVHHHVHVHGTPGNRELASITVASPRVEIGEGSGFEDMSFTASFTLKPGTLSGSGLVASGAFLADNVEGDTFSQNIVDASPVQTRSGLSHHATLQELNKQEVIPSSMASSFASNYEGIKIPSSLQGMHHSNIENSHRPPLDIPTHLTTAEKADCGASENGGYSLSVVSTSFNQDPPEPCRYLQRNSMYVNLRRDDANTAGTQCCDNDEDEIEHDLSFTSENSLSTQHTQQHTNKRRQLQRLGFEAEVMAAKTKEAEMWRRLKHVQGVVQAMKELAESAAQQVKLFGDMRRREARMVENVVAPAAEGASFA